MLVAVERDRAASGLSDCVTRPTWASLRVSLDLLSRLYTFWANAGWGAQIDWAKKAPRGNPHDLGFDCAIPAETTADRYQVND